MSETLTHESEIGLLTAACQACPMRRARCLPN